MTNEEIIRGLNHVGTYLCAKKDQEAITAAVDKLTPGQWDRVFEDKWIFVCTKCGARKLTASNYCPDCGSDNKEVI